MVSLFQLGYELGVAGAGSVKLWESFRGSPRGGGRRSGDTHWARCSNTTEDGPGYMIELGKRLQDEGFKNRSPISSREEKKSTRSMDHKFTTVLLADVCASLVTFFTAHTKRYRNANSYRDSSRKELAAWHAHHNGRSNQ